MKKLFSRLALAGALLQTGSQAQEKTTPSPPAQAPSAADSAPARMISNYEGPGDGLIGVPGVVGVCMPDNTELLEKFSLFFQSKSLPKGKPEPDPQIVADSITKAGEDVIYSVGEGENRLTMLAVSKLKANLEAASADLSKQFGFPVYYMLERSPKITPEAESCKTPTAPATLKI